jgi:hypothetical protein
VSSAITAKRSPDSETDYSSSSARSATYRAGALTTAIELAAALLIAKALLLSTPGPPGSQDRWTILAAVAVATLALLVTDVAANTFPVAAQASRHGPVANMVGQSPRPDHATTAHLVRPTTSSLVLRSVPRP